MKVAINVCFGGFSLSRKAVKRLAELQGRECYFFEWERTNGRFDLQKYTPAEPQGDGRDLFWVAFDLPNPNEALQADDMAAQKALYTKHVLDQRPDDRADPLLIRVIEELGEEANGGCASLRIVEIPDGIEYEIQEYDGSEHVAEKHRTWS